MKNRRNIVEQKYPPENPNDIWLKDGKFYRSTSEGWVAIGSEIKYTNKESMIADKPEGGTIGIDKETGETSIYNDVSKQWSPLGSGGGGMTETTWQELKDKRNNGQLIPGSLYRITDYNCTTTQENTRSAGHQFDIVLLALSENKLAEEGWAMMSESNIYDVTFGDGVTKKCWLYVNHVDGEDDTCNIVDISTNLGYLVVLDLVEINEENKTASTNECDSIDLTEENLPYNYFQNSNLSAWKVWYCLDNDTARFAWADDSMDENVTAKITAAPIGIPLTFDYFGTIEVSGTTYYRWFSGTVITTLSATPSVGDDIYQDRGASMVLQNYKVLSFTPGHEGKYVPSEISIETPSIFDEGEVETNVYKRTPRGDKEKNGIKYYQWTYASFYYYTTKEVPSVGDPLYKRQSSNYVIDDEASLVGFTPGVDAEKGRGVIYRLVDEFNNDVGYDFKNILINDNGETDYYTFSGLLNTEIIDCSTLYTSNPAVHITSNNTICRSFMHDTLQQYINGVFIYDKDNIGFGDMKISSTAIGEFQPRTGCLVNYSFYEEEEPTQEAAS